MIIDNKLFMIELGCIECSTLLEFVRSVRRVRTLLLRCRGVNKLFRLPNQRHELSLKWKKFGKNKNVHKYVRVNGEEVDVCTINVSRGSMGIYLYIYWCRARIQTTFNDK